MNIPRLNAAYRLMVWAILLLAAQLAPAQALYSSTEQAWSGSDLHVEGDAIDSRAKFAVYPYDAGGARGAAIPMTTTVSTGQVAMVRLPAGLANTVYEIAAVTPKGTTNSLYINRPRLQWLDRDKAQPGQLVRVVGRNLAPVPGKTPTVTLTSPSGAVATCARITTDDKYVEFTVPSSLAPGAYTVDVQNGLTTGPVSKSPTSLPLIVVAQTADPYGVGKWWAGDTVGLPVTEFGVNGALSSTRDDAQSFAVALAGLNGHGALHVPAGHYYIREANVVVQYQGCVVLLDPGAIVDCTQASPNGGFAWRFQGQGANAPARGIVGGTFLESSTSVASARTGVLGTFGGPVSRLFLKGVTFTLGVNSLEVQPPNLYDGVIDGCTVNTVSAYAGPLLATNARLTTVTNNVMRYRAGRCTIDFGSRVAILHNSIFFDNLYRSAGSPETGGLQPSVTAQCLVADNDIGGSGPIQNKVDSDGELILDQLNVGEDYSRVGAFKPSTTRIASPLDAWASTSWTLTAQSDLPRSFVAITKGKGAGQWRLAKAWTTTAVQPDRPWQIAPDATSRYVITSSSAYQQTIVGNRLSGSVTGISLYDGGYDCAVDGNYLHNAGGILVRGDAIAVYRKDPAWEARGSNYQIISAWAIDVSRNLLVNDDGVRPAWIALTTQDEGYFTDSSPTHASTLASGFRQYGMMLLGIDVRNNAIVGKGTGPNGAVQSYFPDGLTISNDVHTATDFAQALGVVFEANSLSGCLSSPVYTTTPDHPAPLIAALGNRAVAYPLAPVSATASN